MKILLIEDSKFQRIANERALVKAGYGVNPRCLVALDPHQHGCHTFMLAVLLGMVGLVLARR